MNGLDARVAQLLERVNNACESAGRSFDSLHILLATKTRTADEIRAAYEEFARQGVTVSVGENRAQEMAKHSELDDLRPASDSDEPTSGMQRHFIGRIQTNKARDVVRFADLIHSVDREDLIPALERRANNGGITQRVLLQVNTSGEESKGGFEPDAALLRDQVARCRENGILIPEGLMTIGANTTDEAEVTRSLRLLRELRDQLADDAMSTLSMGMSHDLEAAIAEGATIVRVGSAVFGPRA